jgi:hypothetical protein
MARTVLHVVVAWAIVLGLYSALPLAGGTSAAVRVTVGFVLVAVLIVWELLSVLRAGIPALRALEALGTIVAVFLATFAATYLAMSHADPSRFSTPLDHVGALYFATTVLATVGFGDISAVGDVSQIVVTAQMLLDLVLIGFVVRAVVGAAKLGQKKGAPVSDERASDEAASDETGLDATGPGATPR